MARIKDKSRAATIENVAEIAGVAMSTVSRVLNDGYASPEVRKRVLEAIKQLHFEPSQTARAMRTRCTMTVGVVLPTLLNPFFPSLIRSIKDKLQSHGYTTVALDTDLDPYKEREAIRILRRQAMDGVILVSASKAKPLVDILRNANIPVVLLDEGISNLDVDQVTVNHYRGAQEAMKYAIEREKSRRKHFRIGHLTGSCNAKSADWRLQAYLDSIGEKTFPVEEVDRHPELPIEYADYDFYKGREAMKKLLQKYPDVTCLFAANDMSALGALYYLSSQGKHVPDDIAVIGFDDIEMSSLVHPPLTTIQQPVGKMGEAAAQLLLERIEERKKKSTIKPKQTLTFSPVLVPRESC